MNEAKNSDSIQWITLTYDTKNIPITDNGFMSLSKRDVQLFFKRLRKSNGDSKRNIKYYAVGEYGGRFQRPHYHISIFNADISKIQSAWGKGEVYYVEDITPAIIAYSLVYVSKGGEVPKHKRDDRQKEFSLMSKGLGRGYLTPAIVKWHHADLTKRMYLNIEEGKKCGMPRYYKEKMYSNEERERIKLQAVIDMGKRNKVRNEKQIETMSIVKKEYKKHLYEIQKSLQ